MNTSNVKKIAVLSDIHGNIPALEAVVNDMNQRQVEQVINLGDHISGPLWPKETIEFLMQQSWVNISGNHDKNLVNQKPYELGPSDGYAIQFLNDDEIKWLDSLPKSFELYGMLLFHGTPSNNNTYLLETVENGRARLSTQQEIMRRLGEVESKEILCGHSHIPRVVEIPGSIIINPGSVGLQAYDDEKPEYHIIEAGSPHARYSIIEYQNKIQSIEMISVSYNYQIAAKQAHKNNRSDWAEALNSGFITSIR
jgi:putative phosphoesterase